jgi:ribosomal protein S18 acetylase RimI-like enzyme
VTRREDGLALRVLRVGVHPDALVMHVGTDVVVRTPARPDHHDGNLTDLLAPPEPASVPRRLEGARRLMEPIGVRRQHLRYELPVDAAAPDGVAPDDPARVAALEAAGLRVSVRRVLVLDPVDPAHAPDAPDAPGVLSAPADVTFERLVDPDGDVMAERRWYAASVLDRYAHGEDVTEWRAWDDAWGAWQRERVRALARLRRAEVRLAARHGMPVATLTLLDDLDGLVVIDGIITHPAHRRRGIARALVADALLSLRGIDTVEHVAIAVAPASPRERLAQALGFRPVADVRSWQHAAAAAPPAPEAPSAPAPGGPAEAQR